ncbi:MAG: Omp28-related outer membrane protein [Bacteroidales bacterium]|nr:Omp28-related outer membrane protein [Bacteroidales bacterium]
MKRILLYISAIVLAASCSGTVDPENQDPGIIPDEFTEPFTLSVDKAEVEASGKDIVTFSLKDAYGREMLDDKNTLQGVNITSEEGVRVTRMEKTISFISNGTYHFSAKYKGKNSANTVEVVARNRASYEKYHKNVGIYKATATWCGPCAVMTKALEGLNGDTKAHSVELCWHGQDELSVTPGGWDYSYGEFIISYFGGVGFPTVVLDLKETTIENTSTALDKEIWDLRAQYPATCGIKLSTEYDSSNNVINATAELTSATGGSYDMGMVMLLNNQTVSGGTNEGGRYSHIVRAATGNFFMYSSQSLTKVEKDGTMTFTQQIPAGNHKVEDLSVVAFALVPDGEFARMDNIVEVKAGESVDYILND